MFAKHNGALTMKIRKKVEAVAWFVFYLALAAWWGTIVAKDWDREYQWRERMIAASEVTK